MLHIYFKNIYDIRKAAESSEKVEGLDLIWDVDFAFGYTQLCGNETERKIIEDIEHGKYVDETSFTDQYGITLPRDYLSTGCKAVLLTLHNPDKIISTAECGKNALGAIITYCKEGHIILYTDEYRIPYPNKEFIEDIDVECEGHKFTRLTDFNDYIDNR